jgi:hypothetical protein
MIGFLTIYLNDRSGSFVHNRCTDKFLLNRVISPVGDAVCGEADKPAGGGQDSRQWIVKKKQEAIFKL